MDIVLFIFTGISGVISGVLAHKGFNDLIDETVENKALNLGLRYSVGVLFVLPIYMLSRWAQHRQHKKTPPLSRITGDYLLSNLAVGVGIMLPRLWKWWRG